jgi:DNA-directed RNA polymerase specialized sigma subunit
MKKLYKKLKALKKELKKIMISRVCYATDDMIATEYLKSEIQRVRGKMLKIIVAITAKHDEQDILSLWFVNGLRQKDIAHDLGVDIDEVNRVLKNGKGGCVK